MIGGSWPPMFVKWSQRWSFASRRSSSADAAPCVMLIWSLTPLACHSPVVELFPHLQVHESLRRDDVRQRTQPARQLEQMPSIGSNELDDEVELPCRRHDVVGLGPARDRVGGLLRRAAGLNAHKRLLVAEPERVRNGDDLEDPLRRQPSVARADRRL